MLLEGEEDEVVVVVVVVEEEEEEEEEWEGFFSLFKIWIAWSKPYWSK